MSDTDRVVAHYTAEVDPEICEHVDLLVAQLQEANQRIAFLEESLKRLCAEAAKARPLADAEPEAFPARALRFSA